MGALSQNILAFIAALLNSINVWIAAQRGQYFALGIIAGSTAINLAASNNFTLNITGATNLALPTNIPVGSAQSGVIEFTNTAGAAVTFNAYWRQAGGGATPPAAGAGTISVMAYVTDSTGAFATYTMQANVF